MRLEDQVCSLEIARRLKELGVKQESYFFYEWYSDRATRLTCKCEWIHIQTTKISAFTVAELGEMLPDKFTTYRDSCKFRGAWTDKASDLVGKLYVTSDTEADARAKMLIYLIENGLIKETDDAPSQRKESEQ